MTARPCIECGVVCIDTRCDVCEMMHGRRIERRRGSARERGYTTTWDRLSRRARRLQPFCTDCQSPEDLQLDHLPQAWARQAQGRGLRLGIDVEVVCGDCNRKRGAARGDDVTRTDLSFTKDRSAATELPDPGDGMDATRGRTPEAGTLPVIDIDSQHQEAAQMTAHDQEAEL